ncbi:MAG TPA: glycosyltransferase family 39 protein [Bacteroidota bacterium]
MIEQLKRLWNERPLLTIMVIALIPRVIAAIWSKGYAMSDDHFGPIEQPFIIMHYPVAWIQRGGVYGHSIVYPSIHYALFNVLQAVGIQDPQTTMYIVRFLHALFSLLVVYYGFKIAEVLSDREVAKKTGLILALFWALPFLSVRNLIEVVCIPPLMAGFYYVLVSEQRLRNAFVAGLWLGLAFVFRYQTLMVTGTIGLILLFRKNIKGMALVAGGFLVTAILIQGTADTLAWGYPFSSFAEYVRYNWSHGEEYTTGPWYNYIVLVLGALIPPISFFLVFGFFKNWRKTLILILPVLVFFVLHSTYPNKQERFILPVLPLILVLSVVGWEEFVKTSQFWMRHQKVLRTLWVWFWAVNAVLLVLFSTYYCKKARVESMYSLYGKPVTELLRAGGKDGVTLPPFFYTGNYPVWMADISTDEEMARLISQYAVSPVRANYILFDGSDNFDERVRHIESTLGLKMVLVKRFDPSFLDYIFYRLNPRHNKNETIYIFQAIYNGEKG